jgi:hypothetical protein
MTSRDLQPMLLMWMLSIGCGQPAATEKDAAVVDDLGGSPDAGVLDCPNDLPQACPTPAPSYVSEVQPLIANRCVPCHSPGGLASDRPLDDYTNVYKRRGTVLNEVYTCLMPPADAGQLSDAERKQLLSWLVCDAPNN